jgi:hypothetical protein
VYGDEEAAEGERFPLSKIKEVIRTEELEPERPKKGKRSRKGKSKKQKDESSDEDEIDDDADLWEKETGVLHGYVSKWDPVAQTSTAEEEVIGMISRMVLGILSLLTNSCRHRVRTVWFRDKRSQRRVIQIRKTPQFFIHRLRCC